MADVLRTSPAHPLSLEHNPYMNAFTQTSRLTVYAVVAAGLAYTLPAVVWGAGGESSHTMAFLFIALILLAAKASSLIERFGQPAVLGELLVGVLLGNLALLGITVFEPIKEDVIIAFLAQLGVVILLFQIGLESNFKEMTKVGRPALLVAIAGVVAPFGLGVYVVGPWLLPEADTNTLLFLGAALTATSVGITARVFKDLGKLQTRESQIVLGAAVIDDVMGLIILAVVSAIATVGAITGSAVAIIILKAILFLGGAIVLGQFLAPHISLYFSKIHTGVGMKFTLAFSVGLLFAYAAAQLGLAPIIGAFAGGLILDAVVFRRFRRPEMVEELAEIESEVTGPAKGKIAELVHRYEHRHIEDLIEPVAQVFVPIFFVVTGMAVDLTTFADTSIILTALGITAVAFAGKIVAGFFAGEGVNKWIVGFGMVPRGEVGLIFATIGAGLGVVTDGVFSVIIIMVILTTLLTPPVLTHLLKKQPAA
jgi:Kef-type K+ transport system membrane component KefB